MDPQTANLRARLKTLGAPLHGPKAPVDDLERTIVEGVHLAHVDAAVASVLPLCIFQQRGKIDADRLSRLAANIGEGASLGFLLDITSEISGDMRFRTWVGAPHAPHVSANFFEDERDCPVLCDLAEMHTPALARSWGFTINLSLASFQSLFDKFRGTGHVF